MPSTDPILGIIQDAARLLSDGVVVTTAPPVRMPRGDPTHVVRVVPCFGAQWFFPWVHHRPIGTPSHRGSQHHDAHPLEGSLPTGVCPARLRHLRFPVNRVKENTGGCEGWGRATAARFPIVPDIRRRVYYCYRMFPTAGSTTVSCTRSIVNCLDVNKTTEKFTMPVGDRIRFLTHKT